MIDFWSYKKEYKKYKKDILKSIDNALIKGNIFFGDELLKFEKNFTKKYNYKYGLAVKSCTDALYISLKVLGVKKGDEVITAANTAIPTISAIILAGAKPKLVDISSDYLINVNHIKKSITSKTKAIIPVHLYGQSCDMPKILKIAKKYKLKIIEDCAQAQGAKFKNKHVGSFGDFGCFSFYPTKILGAYGDGGFIVTNNQKFFEKAKRIRFYGIETEVKKNSFINQYYANEFGINSRMDEIQSSILNFKLNKVDQFIKKRRKLAKLYFNYLSNTDLMLPKENDFCKHAYHLFTVRHKKAKKIIKILKRKGVNSRIIYQYPIHKMKAFKIYNFNQSKLNISEKISKEIFSLPLYPELTSINVKKICKILMNILNNC
ncbi:MAG: DegT/DnrJ/EryC1/StrS family aminotransferase [Pelagibacterales bacterium]|nr:DegT/DnrJ/EryC1/StrS family aminotransferase [Pelagibacterales bacterium]|tara:strand:+ start:2028 stop:3155 length:1128 start_codon:yes stop_codon:yes gene_type:complete